MEVTEDLQKPNKENSQSKSHLLISWEFQMSPSQVASVHQAVSTTVASFATLVKRCVGQVIREKVRSEGV